MEIYLINRTDRPERRKHAMEQLGGQGLNAHLFPAIINKQGYIGCRDSHLECLYAGLKTGKPFTIFEDDVLFIEDIEVAQRAMGELPSGWDALFLGASPQEPFERYSPHLYKMGRSWCTHAIIWNPRKDGAVEAILRAANIGLIGKIDVFYSAYIFTEFNIFLVAPMVCTQAEFQSDIAKRSDVSTIVKNFNKYCK
jgi:hypothetical protein